MSRVHKISEHVYWMPPAEPDRPSLGAVVGADSVLMLDAGASSAHAREFLSELEVLGIRYPDSVALTHWHWDHVFGAAEVGTQLIAQSLTTEKLVELSKRGWSDSGLEEQLTAGLETREGLDNIKAEMPAPRCVSVAEPNVIFQDELHIQLGAVTCHIKHVGGDHTADSSVIFVQPDRVLFLGDCLCSDFYAPQPEYTAERLIPLLDTLEEFDADYYIEGHECKVATRAEFKEETAKMREAVRLVDEIGFDEEKIVEVVEARTGKRPDQDLIYYLKALIAGAVGSKKSEL